MTKRILVTGSHGFIGSALCERLHAEGYEVSRVDKKNGTNVLSWPRSAKDMEGVDLVYHLAARSIAGNDEAARTLQENIQGSMFILEAARQAKAPVVFASSYSVFGAASQTVYGNTLPFKDGSPIFPTCAYSYSKAVGDMLSEYYRDTQDIAVISARLANIYGPGDREKSRLIPATIMKLMAGEAPVFRSLPNTARDFVYIDDCVEALLRLGRLLLSSTTEGFACNVASGQMHSIKQVVDTLVKLVPGAHQQVTYEDSRVGESFHRIAEAETMRRLLNWKPEVDLAEGLYRTVKWWTDEQ